MAKVRKAVKEAMTLASQSLGSTADRVTTALQNILNGRGADEDPCDGSCCTGCGYECSGNCCPNCDGKNRVYCWVRDVFPASVVYSVSGQLYQRPWASDAAGVITFGDEVPVEVAYSTIGESHREMVTSVQSLTEAGGAYNAKTGELTITVIRPGLNSSKSKFYPAAVLKRDMGIFENAKMFLNHQTDKEAKERPEGDVRQWVAQVGKPWAEADGRVRAKAKVIDPAFKEKLGTLQEAGLLHEMGVSIRAIGVGSEAEVSEAAGKTVKTMMVERLIASRSVDFVTYPGAGGQCEVLESERNDGHDLELVNVAELRERRPDLVELIESNARKAIDTMKTLEQQLQEAQAANATAAAENTRLTTALAEANSKNAKADAAKHLATLLEAAKLPKAAHDRILEQFKEAAAIEGMKEAIEAMKTLVESLAPAAKVRGMGSDVNAEESTTGAPAGRVVKPEEMVECFQSLGLTEVEAKIAAAKK